MSKPRASIFEDFEELDVSSFAPKSASDQQAPAPEAVRAIAEAANFTSRQANAIPVQLPETKNPVPVETETLNFRVTSKFKNEFKSYVATRGITMSVWLRLAFDLYRKHHGS